MDCSWYYFVASDARWYWLVPQVVRTVPSRTGTAVHVLFRTCLFSSIQTLFFKFMFSLFCHHGKLAIYIYCENIITTINNHPNSAHQTTVVSNTSGKNSNSKDQWQTSSGRTVSNYIHTWNDTWNVRTSTIRTLLAVWTSTIWASTRDRSSRKNRVNQRHALPSHSRIRTT